jgi:hypothetical protein
MTRWIDLYKPIGIYESDAFDIASDFDVYIPEIITIYDENDGIVTVEVRVSFDNGVMWSDWFDVKSDMLKNELNNNQDGLKNAKFQYRVIMDMTNNLSGISSVFKSFNTNFNGAFKIINTGDVVCKPELWIKKKNGSGSIRLTNETNGLTLELNNLNDGEEVYIDCENEDIVSSLPLTYRYNDHNNVFIELEVGENLLTGEGDFELDMRFEFKTLQG